MTGFNETSLAQLRALNVATLTSLALIERPTRAASPGGGANTGKVEWTEVGDEVPCRLSTLTDTPIVQTAGQLRTPEKLLLVLDLAGPSVRQGDRVTVTGTDAAGQDWTRAVTVLSLRSPRTYSAMRVFVCEDVAPGVA